MREFYGLTRRRDCTAPILEWCTDVELPPSSNRAWFSSTAYGPGSTLDVVEQNDATELSSESALSAALTSQRANHEQRRAAPELPHCAGDVLSR